LVAFSPAAFVKLAVFAHQLLDGWERWVGHFLPFLEIGYVKWATEWPRPTTAPLLKFEKLQANLNKLRFLII
jgi:hypothetical protein